MLLLVSRDSVSQTFQHIKMKDHGKTAAHIIINREASVYQNNPYHCVLIIELNDNNRRVISQFTGLPKQLHILKNQQLVPRGAEGLSQHL